jgi:hypothetical protein
MLWIVGRCFGSWATRRQGSVVVVVVSITLMIVAGDDMMDAVQRHLDRKENCCFVTLFCWECNLFKVKHCWGAHDKHGLVLFVLEAFHGRCKMIRKNAPPAKRMA